MGAVVRVAVWMGAVVKLTTMINYKGIIKGLTDMCREIKWSCTCFGNSLFSCKQSTTTNMYMYILSALG